MKPTEPIRLPHLDCCKFHHKSYIIMSMEHSKPSLTFPSRTTDEFEMGYNKKSHQIVN